MGSEDIRLGLNLSDHQDRPERLGDVARGLASSANEALSTSKPNTMRDAVRRAEKAVRGVEVLFE